MILYQYCKNTKDVYVGLDSFTVDSIVYKSSKALLKANEQKPSGCNCIWAGMK